MLTETGKRLNGAMKTNRRFLEMILDCNSNDEVIVKLYKAHLENIKNCVCCKCGRSVINNDKIEAALHITHILDGRMSTEFTCYNCEKWGDKC